MADNVAVTPGTGATIATDDVGGVQFQKVKLDVGSDGASSPVTTSNPLPSRLTTTAADFQPGYSLQSAGETNLATDPGGNLLVRSQTLTDEGTFRVNFANSSLAVSLGTLTLTNGSAAVSWSITEATDLHAGDYVKLDADAESAWAQILSIDSTTSGTLATNYTGTGGTSAGSRAKVRQFTGTGGAIAVASGQLTITAGTTTAARTGISRFVDYAPLIFRARFSLSARNSNQNFYAGLREDAVPTRWFARFDFNGATATSVDCSTGRNPTGAPSASETQTTTVTMPNAASSASAAEYRIELMTEQVRFYINDVLVATHTSVIPQTHDEMLATCEFLNGTTPSTSVATVDYVAVKNHNKLEMSVFSNSDQIVATPPNLTRFAYSQAGVIAINTVLLTVDCAQFKSLSIQCTSMGTTGVVTPEWSSDPAFGTNLTDTIFTIAGASATTFNAAGGWVTNVKQRYFRLRLSTATTAGTTTINVDGCMVRQQTFLATQPVSGTVTANIGTGSLAAGTNAIGDVGIQYRANATGAATLTNINCPATPAAQQLKSGAGRLVGLFLYNTSASVRWVKIFNLAGASVTPGTTSATTEIGIPAGQRLDFNSEGGAGFSTGITVMITGAAGLTNNTSVTLADVTGFSLHA